MRARLLLIPVLLASPTIAADEDSSSKRTCNDETYTRLVAEKVNTCDRVGTMKCNQNTACPEIPNQIIKLNKCIAARRAVMDQCYQGGDRGHQEQVRNLQYAVENCFRELEARCTRDDDESCKE
jgi:hypothetical protein